ncbi:MAG: MotA/TolQ/ExbB proton channel family protein [Chlamydiales bacterium]|nr:MotA/TolQ/ExbB proton channel family protein [Chlamydiales bacterium]
MLNSLSLLAQMGTFSTAYAQSDSVGKLIIFSLIGLSALCWIVLIYKIWITRHVRVVSSAFLKAFEKNWDCCLQMDLNQLPKPLYGRIPHPFGHIFEELKGKTLEILNKNHYFFSQQATKESLPVYLSSADLEIVETHVWTAISSQKRALEKNLFVLSTVMTLAPFLGLLGTVWGILVTFSQFQVHGAASSNTAILGGISTALVTTVLGLVIAIPALISYNYLKNAIGHYTSEMEDFLYRLLSAIELQYRKVDTHR